MIINSDDGSVERFANALIRARAVQLSNGRLYIYDNMYMCKEHIEEMTGIKNINRMYSFYDDHKTELRKIIKLKLTA